MLWSSQDTKINWVFGKNHLIIGSAPMTEFVSFKFKSIKKVGSWRRSNSCLQRWKSGGHTVMRIANRLIAFTLVLYIASDFVRKCVHPLRLSNVTSPVNGQIPTDLCVRLSGHFCLSVQMHEKKWPLRLRRNISEYLPLSCPYRGKIGWRDHRFLSKTK